jgi:hypothetical protein
MEFEVKLTENLILKYHITEDRPLCNPPETTLLTRMLLIIPPIMLPQH